MNTTQMNVPSHNYYYMSCSYNFIKSMVEYWAQKWSYIPVIAFLYYLILLLFHIQLNKYLVQRKIELFCNIKKNVRHLATLYLIKKDI